MLFLPGFVTVASWLATAYPWAWFLSDQVGDRQSALFPPDVLGSGQGRAVLAVAAVSALAGGILLRRRPALAFALVLSSVMIPPLAWQRPEIWSPQIIPVGVALASLALTATRRVVLAAAGLTVCVLAGFLIARLTLSGEGGTPSEPFMAVSTCTAVLAGLVIRQSRAQAAAAHQRATAEAITEERLRIARDLHDMVAHNLGAIALQAGAAGRVMQSQPEAAREAVGSIERIGRETLSGVRRVVSGLRLCSLSGLDQLIATTRAAGIAVDLRWEGRSRSLPMEIDAAAFRIVQEAVANVIHHAGTPACRILISCRESELFVEVLDDGRGAGSRLGAGFGLTGMRERVELLRGTITTGTRPEGGFRVAARLPLPADAP
ncbi:sensor histidine kinase [Actinoplanes sp. NPDC051861]|uniref:sensor histidine kinase n=1 Tax=Actinoplanes sp. NPDC051861 TaxID=3155170 RepID=UPI0034416D76